MELDNLNALRYIIPETLFLLEKEKDEFQMTEEELSALNKANPFLEVVQEEEQAEVVEQPKAEVQQVNEIEKIQEGQIKTEIAKSSDVISEQKGGIQYLGENKRNILVIVDFKEGDFYKSKEFQLLLKIMESVYLTLNEFVLVNLNENREVSFKKLKDRFLPQKVFYYTDTEINTYLGDLTKYQIIQKEDFQLISSDSLTQLEIDITKKKQLWGTLKQVF